jgi:cell division protein FtsB
MGTLFGLSRARLTIAVCLVLAGYFVYTAAIDATRNQEINQDRLEAAQELQALNDRLAYLEAVRDYVASDGYVEQQARRQLGYIRPGEIAFVVNGPEAEVDDTAAGSWWERLFPR